MKASEGKIGRVFVIRLEDGDVIPACIESFAAEKKISTGQVILVGGIGGGQVVVGPRRSDEMPPESMLLPVDGVHEIVGAGTIAPDKKGKPSLHIHASLGRSGQRLASFPTKAETANLSDSRRWSETEETFLFPRRFVIPRMKVLLPLPPSPSNITDF